MRPALAALCTVAGVWCVSAASYPASFPFENESNQPVQLVASTPSLTFDDEDVGGYVYHYWSRADFTITDEDMPFCPHHTDFYMYALVATFGAPPVLPKSTWNCTDKQLVFEDADFTGLVNGETVCSVGACCANLIGRPKFSEDQMEWHTWLTDRAATALCGDLSEHSYCIFVGGDFQTNCIEFYLTPGTRLVVFPCFDSWFNYFLTCPVYKQAYTTKYVPEPMSYMDSLSNEQLLTIDPITFLGDRVCNPYSYYAPSTSTSGTQNSETDTGTTAASAGIIVGGFTLAALMMLS